MTSLELLDALRRAAYPIIYVVSPEEGRVETSLLDLALDKDIRLLRWSMTQGLSDLRTQTSIPDMNDPFSILEYIESQAHAKSKEGGLWLLRDFGHFLNEGNCYLVQRKLRDVAYRLTDSGSGYTVVILDSELVIPPRLEKIITVIDYDLPTVDELYKTLREMLADSEQLRDLPEEQIDAQVRAGCECAAGLTLVETENVFAKSLAMSGYVNPKIVMGEKKNIIRKSGVLEYFEVDTSMKDVGGLNVLKEWLTLRGKAFTPEAREYGLPVPKGVLLVGVAGTGKSLISKCIGSLWNMPVLRMDVGALFGAYLGMSESNMRKALKTAEALAPCVLFLDEIDKALSGGQGGQLDSGTTSRVFGTFLTWMQEKTAQVFTAATCNMIHALPPELLRKGRSTH